MTAETVLPPTYNELVERRVVLQDELERLKVRHEQEIRILRGKLEPVERAIRVAEGGFDPVQFQLARAILEFDWGLSMDGRRRTDTEIAAVFRHAVEQLRLGGGMLRTSYIGLKQYDRWAAQEVQCEYGFGPAHGSVWFRIGLSQQYRRRPAVLQEYERIACIAWLNAVKDQPALLNIAEGRVR